MLAGLSQKFWALLGYGNGQTTPAGPQPQARPSLPDEISSELVDALAREFQAFIMIANEPTNTIATVADYAQAVHQAIFDIKQEIEPLDIGVLALPSGTPPEVVAKADARNHNGSYTDRKSIVEHLQKEIGSLPADLQSNYLTRLAELSKPAPRTKKPTEKDLPVVEERLNPESKKQLLFQTPRKQRTNGKKAEQAAEAKAEVKQEAPVVLDVPSHRKPSRTSAKLAEEEAAKMKPSTPKKNRGLKH